MDFSASESTLIGSKVEADLYASVETMPPLDITLFKPTADQLQLYRQWLHIEDEDHLKEHMLEVQRE